MRAEVGKAAAGMRVRVGERRAAAAQEGVARGLGRRGARRVRPGSRAWRRAERRAGESGRGEGGRREGEEKENGKKGKMRKKKGKRERREREREGETRAGADRGDDRGAGRPRSAVACARGRGHRERGRGSEIGRLEQRKIPGIRVQGFRRILSSTMKSFGKKYFSA